MRFARGLKPSRVASASLTLAVVLGLFASACKSPDLRGPTVSVTAPFTPTATAEATAPVRPGPTLDPEFPGVGDEVIRIGVIADGDTGDTVTPHGQAAWLAMRVWAQAVNDSGGLGGREVEVVLIVADEFNHGAAIEEACRSNIFALVGSYARFDGDGLDVLNHDSCRLPDFPAAALSPDRRQSPVTFVSNPISNTVWQAGPARVLSERFPVGATAAGAVVPGSPETTGDAQREIEAFTAGGFTFVSQTGVEGPDADYDALASELSEARIQSLTWTAEPGRLPALLNALNALADQPILDPESTPEEPADPESTPEEPAPEESTEGDTPEDDAEEQGIGFDLGALFPVEPDFVHCSSGCYSHGWAGEAGDLELDIWVSITMLPFEEPGQNVELVEYLSYLNQVDPEAGPSLIGLSSWASARLFEDAVTKALFRSGGGLTRELVIEAAETITEWNGLGLHGPTNPADGIPSPCFVMVSPTPGGGWVRRHPLAPGTMDCDENNLVALVESATLGTSGAQPES